MVFGTQMATIWKEMAIFALESYELAMSQPLVYPI